MTVIRRRVKRGKEGQKRKKGNKRKERKTKQKTSCMRARRRPSPERTVVVCWHNQSHDMSRGWTNRRTAREDQTEGK